MADVANTLPSWSVTRSSNNPQGGTVIGAGLDDNLREIQGVTRAWLASKGADIASATTTDIGAVEGLFHDITGTTTITGLGTVDAGIWKVLKFEGVLTLTHNATSLIIPGGANITTADGDMCKVTSEGSGNWRMNWYSKASGVPFIDTTAAARKVLNINSHWLIDQLNEGALYASVNASAINGPDGWTLEAIGAGVFKVRTLADPDNAAMKVLEITCTTADASIGASDAYIINTNVEGYDLADLKSGTASADYVTIQFTSDFSVTGTFGIALRNSALNRVYIGTFTQAVANSRETQTLTLQLDTSGTWLYTNGVGTYISICLAAGTDNQTTTGWQAGNFLTTSAQANFMSSTSNIGYIGPVQVIPGRIALAFGPADIAKQLARCQRYLFKTFPTGTAAAQGAGTTGARRFGQFFSAGTNSVYDTAPFPVKMRAVPTMTGYNPSASNAQARNTSTGTDYASTTLAATEWGWNFSATAPAASTQGQESILHAIASARLT